MRLINKARELTKEIHVRVLAIMFAMLFILFAKCEVFRSEETICHSYNCCEQFRWRWPDVEIFNKELHADIVDDNRAENT